MKAYVSSTGCEQRDLDAQRIINYFKDNDIHITNHPEDADYLCVITCGVDQYNEEKSLREISELQQKNPYAKILVGGCLPKISPEKINEFNVFYSFSPRSVESLDKIFAPKKRMGEIPYPTKAFLKRKQIEKSTNYARNRFEKAKNGYKIRISEGCLNDCSYCMIKEATGKLKSDSIESILQKVDYAIDKKEPTIMLMAGDTGAYGIDNKTNFSTLLNKIISSEGHFKLFIHDFGISWLINDLNNYEKIFQKANQNKRIGGITFPIQSGSNKILELMNRKYSRENIIQSMNLMKKFDFDIGTHIMVGFPGETKDDFHQTLQLLEQARFDFFTCFAYSEHPRAKSAKLENKVSSEIINKRLEQISSNFGDIAKVIQ
ncbi:radical SAM protein [Candidatus Woesearchaeota archaeon]|nr:radical SAM protein [Candidatus Woesearchaeota archaeon]